MTVRDGFTFVEALITISVLLGLTSILLLYNKSGERQLVLLKEKANIVGAILKARSSSINTLISSEPICGYGVHFENDGYLIFKDRAADCLFSDRVYTEADPEELSEKFSLPFYLKFARLDFRDVFFMPPNPTVFFDGNFSDQEKELLISSDDGKSKINLKLNSNGQISE